MQTLGHTAPPTQAPLASQVSVASPLHRFVAGVQTPTQAPVTQA